MATIAKTAQQVSIPSAIAEALNRAKRIDNRLETILTDGTKVTFRRDFGEHAHPIGKKYPKPVDHYNIELHEPIPGTNRFNIIENSHIIVDETGNVIDVYMKNKK